MSDPDRASRQLRSESAESPGTGSRSPTLFGPATALTPKGPIVRFNFLPAVRRSKFSAVSRRARLALGVVGAVVAAAALTGPAGAGPSEANINSDANYAISITRNLNTVNLGDVVSWTVTFKHTATTGPLDQSASLSVSVPASVTPISWQCVAQTGSFCNSRGGSQSASTSGTGQPILLPGLGRRAHSISAGDC